MTALTWDGVGEKVYETGVDHGVLYLPNPSTGVYDEGVAWNGLVSVTESPSGAEPTATYADNIKYMTLLSAEEFAATIEAYTYPSEFAECDGTIEVEPGVLVGQQVRKSFGMVYRTLLGNDLEGNAAGYKLHLLYGCLAAPSEKAYTTINDSPEAITFSWEVSTTPQPITGMSPTSLIVIDSTEVDPTQLALLEAELFGDGGGDANLPTPDQVVAFFAGALTAVDMGTFANQPTYNSGTHVVTLPAVTGVQWKINGEDVASGAQPALAVGETAEVEATPLPTYQLDGDRDWTFDY